MSGNANPKSEAGAPASTPNLWEGPVLCLSGGGFRATLFHLGALRRLNELGVLARLKVITSVSGGSILNGLLASRWHQLQYQPDGTLGGFSEIIAEPIRCFCRRDLRTDLLVGLRLNPACWPVLLKDFFSVRANFLAAAYERLYEESWLSCVAPPQPGRVPRFVFCATNVQTGACWHFHSGPEGRMGDFYTGYMKTGHLTIAHAVAASSAFPPGFGALRLPISSPDAFSRIDPWGIERPLSSKREQLPEEAKRLILLTDGGVYDNLGVEPVWNYFDSLLISDAGHPFSSKAKCGQAILPRLKRAAEISQEQVGAVRKRWFMERIQKKDDKEKDAKRVKGTMWAINTRIEEYPIAFTIRLGLLALSGMGRLQ